MQSYDSFVLQNLQLSSIVVQNVVSVNLHFVFLFFFIEFGIQNLFQLFTFNLLTLDLLGWRIVLTRIVAFLLSMFFELKHVGYIMN